MEIKNHDKFLKLYEPIHGSFVRFCQARAHGITEAEELVSESVLLALESFENLKNEEAFLSFMFSIASNVLNKKLRRKKFLGFLSDEKQQQIHYQGEAPDAKLDIEVLYNALKQLPAAQEEALVLFEISGFSIKEISEIQQCGESAVKQRLKRGREKLAEFFSNDQLQYESSTKQSQVLMNLFL